MLENLITSKTRLRLLIKFFISQANHGYLNGLANEMGESTNSIRKELNNLFYAGYLKKYKVNNKVEYKANTEHPLFEILQKVVLKHLGIEEIIEAVLESKKYENSISEILKAKDIVLNDFNFIYRFKKKFEKLKKNLPKSKITVFNRKHFISMAVLPMHKIPINAVGRIFRRIGNGIIKFSS